MTHNRLKAIKALRNLSRKPGFRPGHHVRGILAEPFGRIDIYDNDHPEVPKVRAPGGGTNNLD